MRTCTSTGHGRALTPVNACLGGAGEDVATLEQTLREELVAVQVRCERISWSVGGDSGRDTSGMPLRAELAALTREVEDSRAEAECIREAAAREVEDRRAEADVRRPCTAY